MAAQTPAFPSAPAPVADPRAAVFEGVRIGLLDLYRDHVRAGGGSIIEDRVFSNCLIEGPALMLVLEGVHFESTNFGPTGGHVRNMLFRPLGDVGIGAIPVRNSTFRNCSFHVLGITGSDELLQLLTDQVKTAS